MFFTRLYYHAKPWLPYRIRAGLRRWRAPMLRRQHANSWPIQESAGRPPEGWPGWPEDKRFAFVLTHDVEGPQGLARVRELAELEMSLGFRSSFNFIPEGGDYEVSRQLRDWLVEHGFEVGVHDLHHDGKLFRSPSQFRGDAQKINAYLKTWNAVGFRAGFMLHRLSWMHDLDILYDASTFDVDPFEPQPDGVNTIFPFWIPKPFRPQEIPSSNSRSGYVELPYTLVQDSTLFLSLGERTVEVWTKKLDWIADRGGMALVNVHPDYVNFAGDKHTWRKFPARLYSEFLQHVAQRYDKCFWQPLPKTMAAFVAQHKPRRQPVSRRICMVTYSDYWSDTRVMHYAEALAERGDTVDVLALQGAKDCSAPRTPANIRVAPLQQRVIRTERNRSSYLFPVVRFTLAAFAWIFREHRRNPYDLAHIHNMPDFLVFAVGLPKLTGTRVILDIHDLVPEFYASKFGANTAAPSITILKWIERAAAKFADYIIISNHLWRDKYVARTGTQEQCSVRINNVDTSLFCLQPRTRNDGKFILLFPGGLQWHQGLDIAIQAFSNVSLRLPHAEFHIYGDGNMKPSLLALTRQLKLEDKVRFFDPIPTHEIVRVMANADLGVVPKRADSFGNEAYSTKIMEFMALGIPVVVSRTRIDSFYFSDQEVRFFESGNVEALAKAIIELAQNPAGRELLSGNGLAYAERNSWETRKAEYWDLVDSLING